jgi:hypothetical protein
MGRVDVRKSLRAYETELRALVRAAAAAAGSGVPLTPVLRARYQALIERVNADLLALYERARQNALSGDERTILLPATEELRNRLRGVGGARDPETVTERLRAAVAAVATG